MLSIHQCFCFRTLCQLKRKLNIAANILGILGLPVQNQCLGHIKVGAILQTPHFGLDPKGLYPKNKKEAEIIQSSISLARLHVRWVAKSTENPKICKHFQVSIRSKQKSSYASNYCCKEDFNHKA